VIAQLNQQTGRLPIQREVVIHNSVDRTVRTFQWEKPFIAWVGNFKGIKHPELFIELTRRFQNAGVDFLMVGKMSEHYEQQLKHAELPASLYLLGPKTYHEVNGILQQALFLVHTSSVDGFSNVLIQAWMQGKPTISIWYDPDNMTKNNEIGLASGGLEQLVIDTKTLIENPSRRKEMGLRAKKFAEAHFDPEVNMQKFEQFFLELCET
jgi:glycosyltransferase involved in cell wall biosynthesis